jgi:hypothetical protein
MTDVQMPIVDSQNQVSLPSGNTTAHPEEFSRVIPTDLPLSVSSRVRVATTELPLKTFRDIHPLTASLLCDPNFQPKR